MILTLGLRHTYNWTIASQLARRQSTNGALSAWPVTARNDSYAVNGLNQYNAVTGRTYTHDDNGNLINNGIRNYAYDVENRLVSVSGSPSMTLSYDPLGRLRQTVAGSSTVQFLYEGDRLIAEYNGSTTTVLRRYVHGPGIDEPIVWYEGSGLTTSTRRWLHTDERGSVIAHSVANGTATPYSYGPYGEPGNDNWTGSRFRYTGQIVFPEAKLYHYKARVYDPIDGRFLQTDPIGYEDDLNLYAYAGNDSTNKFDPTGMYARGDGWSDEEWQNFDAAQKNLADTLSKGADEMRGLAKELRSGNALSEASQSKLGQIEAAVGKSVNAKSLESMAGNLSRAARALSATKGFVAHAGRTEKGGYGEAKGHWIRIDTSHPEFGRGGSDIPFKGQFGIAHEALHTAGMSDQQWSGNGATAYRFSDRVAEQRAFHGMRRTRPDLAINNPDHVLTALFPE